MSGSSDKISVIVPVFNLEKKLVRCVDSILAQTHRSLEVLLVDDGSTDASARVMDDLAAKDARIRVIRSVHRGALQARLTGVQAASGNWIGFVDGDDETAPTMYRRLLENAQKYKVWLSHCGYRQIFPNGTRDFYNTGIVALQDYEEVLSKMLEGEHIEWWSMCNKLYGKVLFTRRLFKALADVTVSSNEDLLANFLLFTEAKRVVYEDEALYFYYSSGNENRHAFSASKAFDRVLAREHMVQLADDRLKGKTRLAYIMAIITAYSEILRHGGGEELLLQLREKIRTEESSFDLLDVDRAEIASLILHTPEAYKAIVANRSRYRYS